MVDVYKDTTVEVVAIKAHHKVNMVVEVEALHIMVTHRLHHAQLKKAQKQKVVLLLTHNTQQIQEKDLIIHLKDILIQLTEQVKMVLL